MPSTTKAPCPNCLRIGGLLAEVSARLRIEYYRCTTCGHVWYYSKETNSPVSVTVHVTPPARKHNVS